MVGALRELIELLLTEIAISGTDGTRLAEIWDLIKGFHNGKVLSAEDAPPTISNFCLDRALQEDLWEWLTLNPEVSVGRNKEFNGLSLSEAEELDSRSPDLRLFVSEDRTWKALTGHEKDDTKVPATEFVLLSIIATCRSQGILQTELVRRSGQDARSVPKRTDALNSKGYIEKRLVHVKSAKTSLCVFSRFAHVSAVDAEVLDTKSVKPRNVIDIDAFCQGLFRVLKQHQIISRNDLKDELDLNDPWRRRILSRTIRKFEAIGCVQRVKARSQFHDTMRSLHPCVLLVHEPTKNDMKIFKSDYKTLFSAVDQDNDDAEEQADMQSSDHLPIKWTPDVNVPNLIANLIKGSGTNGRTNAQVIREGFGKVFRRPSEHTLNRMTEAWQLSQPSHLKHSAIVRDIGMNRTVTHYVHYSYPHFKELVDTARADWEAVTFRARDTKSSKLTVPRPDAPPIIDENGLAPLQLPRKGVIERDYYCILSSKGLSNYATTKSDPVAAVDEEGNVVASFERESGHYSGFRRIANAYDHSKRLESTQIEHLPSPLPEQDVSIRSVPMTKAEKVEVELRRGERSAKEVFASFGMDESWTHVAVQLMERKTPGVYVTGKGKARPARKRQGRPRESRIAIFRSTTLVEYLRSLPPSESDISSAIPVQSTPRPTSREPSTVALEDKLATEPTEPTQSTSHSSHAIPEFPLAKPQTLSLQINAQTISPPTTEPIPVSDAAIPEAYSTIPVQSGVQSGASSKVEGQTGMIIASQTNDLEGTKIEPHRSADSLATRSTEIQPVNERLEPARAVASKSDLPVVFSKSRRSDRGGSVGRLRQNIVMNIIEQAGGAFPTGTELWYAFATVWMKHLNHNEKPDSRTVKNVLKYLIDGGKLRQMTFTGKGPKGFMISRSIVMKPDISSSSPLVTKMKEKLLESTYYVPDNVEVDSDISRLIRGGTGAPTGVHPKQVMESHITVNLRNKPATVVAQEKRREESLQKRLLKPIRLKSMNRKREGRTLFSRPVSKGFSARLEPLQYQGLRKESDIPMNIDISASAKRRLPRASDRPVTEIKRRKRKNTESSYGQFLNHLDDISHWEMHNVSSTDLHQAPSSHPQYPHHGLGFIHHTIHEAFEQAPIAGNIEFITGGVQKQVSASTSQVRARRNKPSKPSKPPLKRVISQPNQPEIPGFREISELPSVDQMQHEQSPGMNKKPALPRRRRRGLKDLPSSLIERMKYAIIVVRTIAGGPYGKSVDWDLVTKAFPEEDPEFIRMNSKLLLNRDRRQLAQMQVEFRAKLLAEYRKRKPALPGIDFNDILSYDWDGVVTWATTQYYSPSARDVPNLPGSRAQFKERFGHQVDQLPDEFESIYTPHPTISITKRASIYSSRPYVNAPISVNHYDRDQSGKLEAVKCWILSNIVAKEETYSATDARQKLSRFSEDMIEDAIKELTRDRFISQSNRGRVVPGRNYSLTDLFYQSFGRKRTIDAEILKQASKFKRTLDNDFRRDGVAQVKYDALDGDVLAVLALAAEGRVHILPSDPPANPFGLTEGNYETRALDKAKFKFQVDVIPDSNRYEYGNPVWNRICANRMPIGEEEINRFFNDKNGGVAFEKLPLWLDINGNIQDQLWESILSAIVGILAIRPKLDLKGIHEQLQKYLALWDIERVLSWLEEVEIVSKEVGIGGKSVWTVKEYWWMVLN
ncbi:hypothetical protein UA08_06906 [Talaromyces atroroseus]|uniref:Uncharacterized protein n=1 Tax=Talaromyces atroroseus TaxID=1441469 RepID=A0A225AA61_TALAT|nr:hypothetical protein UA08_06906 [Talaromyces atroroseus]OKL57712.1 hypothetical protein UA08_06906 [Talaromyces atroroseus]